MEATRQIDPDAAPQRETSWLSTSAGRAQLTLALGALALAFVPLVPTGCGADAATSVAQDGSAADAAVDTAPIVAPAGALRLSVVRARRGGSGGTLGALEVVMALANGSGAPPAPINAALFSVKSSDGLLVTASPGTLTWVQAQACAENVALSAGATHSCALRFRVSAAATPLELIYRTPQEIAGVGDDRRTAKAPFSVEPCLPCGDVCTYTDSDSHNCGACGRVTAPDQRCEAGKLTCTSSGATLCGGRCVDLRYDAANCGRCGRATPKDGYCKEGQPECRTSTPTLCGDECVDTRTDKDNCGACGKKCTGQYGCGQSVKRNTTTFGTVGYCTDPYDDEYQPPTAATCSAICKARGTQCLKPSDSSWAGAYAFCSGYHFWGGCDEPFPQKFVSCALPFGQPHTKCNCVGL